MQSFTSSLRQVAGSSRHRFATIARNFATSAVAREHYLDADVAEFQKRAIDGSAGRPVLVDFYATWCQPCRVLTPLLKSVASPESGVDLVTVDVDSHPELASEYKISSLPTVVAFKDGRVKNKFIGFRPEPELKKFIGML